MTDPMPPLALDLWETVYGEVMNGFTGSNRVWITRTEGRAYMDITPFLGFRQTREGIVETIAAVSRSAAEGTEQLLAERRGEFDIDMSLATLPALLRTAASVLPILARLFWQGIAPFVRGAAGIDEFVTELNGWARDRAADILADDEPAELVENVFEGFRPSSSPKCHRSRCASSSDRSRGRSSNGWSLTRMPQSSKRPQEAARPKSAPE